MTPWRHIGSTLADLHAREQGDPDSAPDYREYLLAVIAVANDELRRTHEAPSEKSAGLDPQRRGSGA